MTTDARPLAILAGAGSGKTRVLTRRIAYRCLTGDADARHVLAVTFTRKAAAELDSRLRTFGLRDLPAAGTFHALAYAQLRTSWAAAGHAAPALLDRKTKVLARVLGSTKRVRPADLAAEIEWAKARLIGPEGYPLAVAQADRIVPVDPERIAEWYRRYEDEKRKRGLVDFDDLLIRCARQIEQDPTFAAAQRWRFRHLFVDEFQDVNPLQHRLLRAWLGDRDDLCVVGDLNQAIYGWNGADAGYLRDFATHHRGAEVIELADSYRSTPQVLSVARAVLATGSAPAQLRAHRVDGPLPVVVGYRSDTDEANGIARAVRDHHGPGRPWSAQAVLVRTNAQARMIEASFRRATIPCRVRGSGRFLDEPDVRNLLTRMGRLSEPLLHTIADLDVTVIRMRTDLLGETGTDPVGGDGAPVGPELPDTPAGRRIEAFEMLVRLGQELIGLDPSARTDAFPAWLRTVFADEDPEAADAVTISSFHAAKGLEWDVVHLAGLEAGLVPITHARTDEARAEERRLLYVAITRAADVLRCSWAQTRSFGSRDPVERAPSPYLAVIRQAIDEDARGRRVAGDPSVALDSSRRSLVVERTDPVADRFALASAVADDIRAWRKELARIGRVQPTVVLSDRALDSISRHRPTTPQELAALPGMGPLTRERHGPDLLAIVSRHIDESESA